MLLIVQIDRILLQNYRDKVNVSPLDLSQDKPCSQGINSIFSSGSYAQVLAHRPGYNQPLDLGSHLEGLEKEVVDLRSLIISEFATTRSQLAGSIKRGRKH